VISYLRTLKPGTAHICTPHAAAAAINRYLLPAGPGPQHQTCSSGLLLWAHVWTDRRTDRQTPYRLIDSALPTMRAVPITVNDYQREGMTSAIIRPHRTHRKDAAYCYKHRTLRDLCLSIRGCLGTQVDCAKTAEPIVSRFCGQTLLGPKSSCQRKLQRNTEMHNNRKKLITQQIRSD